MIPKKIVPLPTITTISSLPLKEPILLKEYNKHNVILLVFNIILIISIGIIPSNSYVQMNTLFYKEFHYYKNNIIIALNMSFGASICLITDIIGDIVYAISIYDYYNKIQNNTFGIDIFERCIILCFT
jgi:hypothetical protein